MINVQKNTPEVQQNYSNNKADIGEAVIGGIITGLAAASAIFTNNIVLYGATAVFLYAEACTLSTCRSCLKQQQKNTPQ